MLVHLGIVPTRNEPPAAASAWLDRTLASVPAHHRIIIKPYAEWTVLRKARRRAEQARFTEHSGRRARGTIAAAIGLLAWADSRGTTLAELTQHDLDQWLLAGGTRLLVRDFLRWARHHGLVGDLAVPRRPGTDPQHFLPDDDRWAGLRRCLHGTDLPLDVRAAGALILIYGLRVSSITELTSGDLAVRDGTPHLLINGHGTVLPPALASLLSELAATATTTSLVGRALPRTTWLFPGQLAGRPLTAAHLAAKLADHGIPAQISRAGALLALASDLPAAVLASLLGLSISAAVRWVHRAKRDWHGFIQARATAQKPSQ